MRLHAADQREIGEVAGGQGLLPTFGILREGRLYRAAEVHEGAQREPHAAAQAAVGQPLVHGQRHLPEFVGDHRLPHDGGEHEGVGGTGVAGLLA